MPFTACAEVELKPWQGRRFYPRDYESRCLDIPRDLVSARNRTLALTGSRFESSLAISPTNDQMSDEMRQHIEHIELVQE